MTISQAFAKMDLRMNKAASADYDNIWPYNKAEALNKAVNSWVRRQKHGKNETQEGDEETDMRVDDLQLLLKKDVLAVRNKGLYAETDKLPLDYLYYKRITPIVSKGFCNSVIIKSHLREEANVDDLITLPSFDLEETFHTLIGNRVHIYHNNDFTVENAELIYYRKPKVYDYHKLTTIMEFKDDICEIIIDETVKILASDIESMNQKNLAQERETKDN